MENQKLCYFLTIYIKEFFYYDYQREKAIKQLY